MGLEALRGERVNGVHASSCSAGEDVPVLRDDRTREFRGAEVVHAIPQDEGYRGAVLISPHPEGLPKAIVSKDEGVLAVLSFCFRRNDDGGGSGRDAVHL